MPSKKIKRQAEPPSEESGDEGDDGFVVDPDQIFDLLPQPFRLVDKILTLIFDQTWEIIEDIEHGRYERRLKANLPVYDCGRQLLTVKEISCVLGIKDTNIVLVSHKLGLIAVDTLLGQIVATHEEEQEKTVLMSACNLQNGFCFVCTLDNKGVARIYCYSGDQIQLVKILNEQDNLVATVLEISTDGSYLGVGWKVPNKDSWLELYKIPKDSWIKEMETSLNQQKPRKPPESLVSLESSSIERHDAASVHSPSPPHSRPSSAQGGSVAVTVTFTKPTTVLKVKPPPGPAPCHATTSAAALKAIDGECSVIGTGVNHILTSEYFQHSNDTFTALHENQLSYLKEDDKTATCAPQFHFLVPSRLVSGGLDTAPGKPNSVAVRWTNGTQLFIYSLLKSSKDLEQKPDVVWPCTDNIVVSATSDCASLLAFGISSGAVVVWDVYRGMLLKVLSVTEKGRVELLHFLPCGVVPDVSDENSTQQQTSPLVNLVVSCDDGTFGVIQCGGTHNSSLVPLLDKSSKETEVVTSILTLDKIPQVIAAGKDTGHVTMYDVKTCSAICHVSLPGGCCIDASVRPQLSAEGKVLVVKGQSPDQDKDIMVETDCVYSFPLLSLPTLDRYSRDAAAIQSYTSDNTIETRLQSMILDRLTSQGSRQLRMEDRWSRFQTELKKMQAEKGRKGNTFWFHSNPSVYSIG